jgi:mono/diheme cytochrome c family protein
MLRTAKRNAVRIVLASLISPPAIAAPGQIQRGKYLVTLGDCEVCHTAPRASAKPFAGGYPLHAIFGTVYSTNITPDRNSGIGKWSAGDFYGALHDGVAPGGRHLYPAFPYPYFSKVSRADSDAMYSYLRTVAPVRRTPRANHLIFPTNIRFMMAFWNGLFSPQSVFKTDPTQSAAWNRGGSLVHGLAHCGGCHTPKNFFFSDRSGELLHGATIDDWNAPNLTGSPRTGLGQWSVADIEEYLKTGKNRFGWVVGNMRDVISISTARWTDQDRHAVATYLKSLPAAPERTTSAPDQSIMQAGQAVYAARCSVCHENRSGDYPNFARNTLLNAADPTTVIRVVLQGSLSAAIPNQQGGFSMPAFPAMDNKSMAEVISFIRNSWGNRGGVVTPEQVETLKKSLADKD